MVNLEPAAHLLGSRSSTRYQVDLEPTVKLIWSLLWSRLGAALQSAAELSGGGIWLGVTSKYRDLHYHDTKDLLCCSVHIEKDVRKKGISRPIPMKLLNVG